MVAMAASTTAQAVTPELRQWIIAQATAGCQPEAVLQSMLASGWQEDVAMQALEDTLRGFLDERARVQTLPPPVVVPEPFPEGAPAVLATPDREVRVLMAMRQPRVLVFGGLLTDAECEELIELARARLMRSETVQVETGGSEVNDARTSQGMFFQRAENALCQRIEARMAALMRWPVENGEGLQILRYGPGAEYKPHYDYFDPQHSGTPAIVQRGGQRVASLVCSLTTPPRGGATVFPDVQLDIAAVRGNAVYFSYDRAHPATKTLHGGAPVLDGETWVATTWVREGKFE